MSRVGDGSINSYRQSIPTRLRPQVSHHSIWICWVATLPRNRKLFDHSGHLRFGGTALASLIFWQRPIIASAPGWECPSTWSAASFIVHWAKVGKLGSLTWHLICSKPIENQNLSCNSSINKNCMKLSGNNLSNEKNNTKIRITSWSTHLGGSSMWSSTENCRQILSSSPLMIFTSLLSQCPKKQWH